LISQSTSLRKLLGSAHATPKAGPTCVRRVTINQKARTGRRSAPSPILERERHEMVTARHRFKAFVESINARATPCP
jgi:hypothetical protein